MKLPSNILQRNDPERNQGQGPLRLPEGSIPQTASRGMVFDTLDAFNDTISFGIWPRLMDAMGVSPDAPRRIEQMRTENPTASMVGDFAGFMAPGMGASAAAARIPALAAQRFLPVFGREAVAGGALTAVDQGVRSGMDAVFDGGEFGIDPTAVAIDSILSGGLGGALQAGAQLFSPTARLRSAGSDFTPADLEAAEAFATTSRDIGIPLNNMEALNQMAGPRAAALQGQYNSALNNPSGSQAAQAFEAAREGTIRETGRDMVSMLGGGISPQAITSGADDAITSIREVANQAASPLYNQADVRHLPPTWVPRHAYIQESINNVRNNPGLMSDLTRDYVAGTGRPVNEIPSNSIRFMDMVRRDMQERIGQMFRNEADGKKIEGMQAQLKLLTDRMEEVAPTYREARGIVDQAMQEIDNLRYGPVGTLENRGTASSQAGSVFGVTTGADAANSRATISALEGAGPDLPPGLLANYIDDAVSSDTMRADAFGDNLFPNTHSRGLVDDVLGPGGAPWITERIDAARAIDPYQARNDAQLSGLSPFSMLFAAMQNRGTGSAARSMQDPGFIGELGRAGPMLSGATDIGRSAIQTMDIGEYLSEIMRLRAQAAAR